MSDSNGFYRSSSRRRKLIFISHLELGQLHARKKFLAELNGILKCVPAPETSMLDTV
jgi:hypothetical protein